MEHRRRLPAALLLAPALALGLTSACGDDGDGTGPGGQPEGPAGDAAAALEQVIDDYFAPNEPTFGSIDFFGGRIATALGLAPAVAAPSLRSAAALVVSCFPTEIDGAIFDYDFGSGTYQVSGSGRPAGSVRFLLYEVDASGNPQQGSQLGYMDVACDYVFNQIDWDVTLDLAVVANDVTVLTADLTGSASTSLLSLNGTGLIRNPAGSPTATFGDLGGSRVFNPSPGEFGSSSGFTIGYGSSPLPGEISLAFGVFGDVAEAFDLTGAVRKGPFTTIPDWEFDALVSAPSGTMSGRVYLASLDDNGLYACAGGTWITPTMGQPSGCAETGETVVDVTSADLNAVRDVFVALQYMWTPLNDLLVLAYDIGELVIPR
jgi:hypothetical protein